MAFPGKSIQRYEGSGQGGTRVNLRPNVGGKLSGSEINALSDNGFERLGDAITQGAENLDAIRIKKKEQLETLKALEINSKLALDIQEAFKTTSEDPNAMGELGTRFAPTMKDRIEELTNAASKEFLSLNPEKTSNILFQSKLAKIKLSMELEANQVGSALETKKMFELGQSAIDASVNSAVSGITLGLDHGDPGSYIIDKTEEIEETIIEAGFAPKTEEQLLKLAQQNIGLLGLAELTNRDPALAVELINSGKFDYLDPNKLSAILTRAQSGVDSGNSLNKKMLANTGRDHANSIMQGGTLLAERELKKEQFESIYNQREADYLYSQYKTDIEAARIATNVLREVGTVSFAESQTSIANLRSQGNKTTNPVMLAAANKAEQALAQEIKAFRDDPGGYMMAHPYVSGKKSVVEKLATSFEMQLNLGLNSHEVRLLPKEERDKFIDSLLGATTSDEWATALVGKRGPNGEILEQGFLDSYPHKDQNGNKELFSKHYNGSARDKVMDELAQASTKDGKELPAFMRSALKYLDKFEPDKLKVVFDSGMWKRDFLDNTESTLTTDDRAALKKVQQAYNNDDVTRAFAKHVGINSTHIKGIQDYLATYAVIAQKHFYESDDPDINKSVEMAVNMAIHDSFLKVTDSQIFIPKSRGSEHVQKLMEDRRPGGSQNVNYVRALASMIQEGKLRPLGRGKVARDKMTDQQIQDEKDATIGALKAGKWDFFINKAGDGYNVRITDDLQPYSGPVAIGAKIGTKDWKFESMENSPTSDGRSRTHHKHSDGTPENPHLPIEEEFPDVVGDSTKPGVLNEIKKGVPKKRKDKISGNVPPDSDHLERSNKAILSLDSFVKSNFPDQNDRDELFSVLDEHLVDTIDRLGRVKKGSADHTALRKELKAALLDPDMIRIVTAELGALKSLRFKRLLMGIADLYELE